MDNCQQRGRIVLITNLNTTNVGNQALSTELMKLAKSNYAGQQVAFLGRSTGLERYTLEEIRRTGSRALCVFEQWADDIVKTYLSSKKGSAPDLEPNGHRRSLRTFRRLTAKTPMVSRLYAKIAGQAMSERRWASGYERPDLNENGHRPLGML